MINRMRLHVNLVTRVQAAAGLVALLLLLIACQSAESGIRPLRSTVTPGAGPAVYDQPLLVTFTQLNQNPPAYQNQLIRVSGVLHHKVPVSCGTLPANGPLIFWALDAEGLRLDAIGLEDILALAPDETELTVDGVWKLYGGPVGCGKEPPSGFVWYLAAQQIIQPNPLPDFGIAVVAAEGDESPDGGSAGSGSEDGERPAGDEAGDGDSEPVGGGNDDDDGDTPPIVGASPTPFFTPDPLTATLTPTATSTPSPTATAGASGTGTPTLTPTGTSIPNVTPSATAVGVPSSTPTRTRTPLPTAGPGGGGTTSAPPPTATPTRTPTPGGYPGGYP